LVKPRENQRSAAMGSGSIWRLIVRFSGPAIISMLVASSYNVVDAIYVGRLGPEALAALTIAFPLMMVFMGLATGTGVGAASLISRRLGAGDHEAADRTAGTTITLSLIVSVLMAAVCLPNLPALLRLFGASGPVLPLAESYVSIMVVFAVIEFFPLGMTNIIRAEGNPLLASTGMIISAVINIILDPVFIFGLGPIPAMGISGAAIATVIGRGVGAAIFIGYLVSGRSSYQLRPSYFIPRLKIIAEIYRVGFASIVRSVAGPAVMVVINRVAATFGVMPLALVGVMLRASSFAFMPCLGLGQGVMPLVGYNYGAKQIDRIGEVVFKSGLVSLVWGAVCWAAVWLFPGQIIGMFNSDPQFIAEGSRALPIFALAFFTIGIQMVLSFFFQGLGKGLASLIMTSIRQVIIPTAAILLLPRLFGLTGLWAVFPVADALGFIVTASWTSITYRQMGIPFRGHRRHRVNSGATR